MGIENKPISKLSFTILNDNSEVKDKNDALIEIKRRFQNNGCDYNRFMEYEEMAISKRGQNISNYLIQDNPTSQLLLETYFNYVYRRSISEHGNLLFSEVLLCNESGNMSKFVKFLKLELQNIKNRLKNNSLTKEEIEKLNLIYEILNKRITSKPKGCWYESSISDCVLDIIDGPHSFWNPEKAEKQSEIMEMRLKEFENGKKISIVPVIISSIPELIHNNEFIDYSHMYLIAYKEMLKLKSQKKSIIKSLKEDDVDYSFIQSKVLTLKKYPDDIN